MDPRMTELMQKLNVIMRKIDETLTTIDASVSQDQLGKLDDLITKNTEIDNVLDSVLTKNTEIDAVLDTSKVVLDDILTKNTEIDNAVDAIGANDKISLNVETQMPGSGTSFDFFDNNEITGPGIIKQIYITSDSVPTACVVDVGSTGTVGELKIWNGSTFTDIFEEATPTAVGGFKTYQIKDAVVIPVILNRIAKIIVDTTATPSVLQVDILYREMN
jgi:hypothetical protein